MRAYIVARDTHTIRPEHRDPQTGATNRMPLFCSMVERFAQALVQGHRWTYSWQQLEADLQADDWLGRWWSEQQEGHTGEQDARHTETGQKPHEDEPDATRMKQTSGEGPKEKEHKPIGCQGIKQADREAREAYARQIQHALQEQYGISNLVVRPAHPCGCPLYREMPDTSDLWGRWRCASCFPDMSWPEPVCGLIASIKEYRAGDQRPAEDQGEADSPAKATPARPVSESYLQPAGWSTREEAHFWGASLLQALLAGETLRRCGSGSKVIALWSC